MRALVKPTLHRFLKTLAPCLAAFLWCFGIHAAGLSGEWELRWDYMGDSLYARLILKEENQKLSGTLLNILKVEGSITNETLTLTANRPNGGRFIDLTGKITGQTLQGAGHWQGDREIVWSAKRCAPPPVTPRTHDFEPTRFHRFFSDAIAPALHIASGDSVRTWTVDAGGVDSKGTRRSRGGNPQTGPFYVEGAMPGDTLAVKLVRLRLDRDTAQSGDRIVGSAVTPDYVANAKYTNDFDSTWLLDTNTGFARLKNPGPRLANYKVKLQPMLGCIAVAPPGHQSFQTGWLGYYGGNLDYNQVREGTTVYLPVNVPGALFFLGDAHAAQGDGELTGDALETSMHVEFTVNVIRGEPGDPPHAENDEYLMFPGIANSLPEAVQSATTALARWLQREYKLEPNEIAVVLGTSIQYQIAELVDPVIHVVARIRKEALNGLK
jgi:acetamidase/formamidase